MKMVTIFFLLISQVALAQVSVEDCRHLSADFGSQKVIPTEIPSHCIDLIKGKRHFYNYDQNADKSIQITGHANILISQIFKETTLQNESIIAGENSRLTNIIAVKLNSANKKAYVLNQDKNSHSVLSYFYLTGGNQVPARKLISEEIREASNINIDHQNQDLYVISKKNGWIKVFNLEADPDGPRPENSVEVKRFISGANTQVLTPIDLVISDNEIFVLDSDRILIFDRIISGDQAPKKVIDLEPLNIKNSMKIELSVDGLNLILIKKDSQKHSLKL